ncbi:hypothetical protein ID866_12071 [Astraeus odoratus]|nr:hypothetical protein ID866_12071 [Astraeus odoratus]
MEGLVGQQQMLISKLVEMSGAAGLERAEEVIRGSEELKEPQGEELGGQEETEGASEEGLRGALENALGNEPGNGTGGNGQEKDKGKQKAI